MTKSEDMWKLNQEYFDPKNDALTDEEKGPFVQYMVARLTFGGPLNINGKRFGLKGDEQDGSDGQPSEREYYRAFTKDLQRYASLNFPEDNGLKVQIDSTTNDDVFNEMLNSDATKSMISVIFVFIYLNIHLKSCFLSFIGITVILLSFPMTVIITNCVL
jgi:hypothetical protein